MNIDRRPSYSGPILLRIPKWNLKKIHHKKINFIKKKKIFLNELYSLRAISEHFLVLVQSKSSFRAVSEQFQGSFRAVFKQFYSSFTLKAVSEQFQMKKKIQKNSNELICIILKDFGELNSKVEFEQKCLA